MEKSIDHIIEQALSFYNSDEAEKIVDLLEAIRLESDNHSSYKMYNKLLAFGYFKNKQITKAEEICQNASAKFPDDFDFYFIKAALHFSLREYKQTIIEIDNYFNLYEPDNDYPGSLTSSDSQQARLYNLAGQAHLNLEHINLAYEYFEQACSLDSSNQNIYINLFHFFEKQKKFKEATQVLEQGISCCNHTAELELLKKNLTATQAVPAV